MHRTITHIPPATVDALVRYSWPGNIRELQNLIERAVILSAGDVLQVPLLEFDDASKTSAAQQTLEEADRAHILATLKRTRWTLSGVRTLRPRHDRSPGVRHAGDRLAARVGARGAR
jgi:formate hydrogenlyase transcriptional activator